MILGSSAAAIARDLLVRARSIIHRLERPLRRVPTLQREAIGAAFEAQAHKLRREWRVLLVDPRLVPTTIIHASFEVSADQRSAAMATVAVWSRPRRMWHPVRVAEVDSLHRAAAVVLLGGGDRVFRVAVVEAAVLVVTAYSSTQANAPILCSC